MSNKIFRCEKCRAIYPKTDSKCPSCGFTPSPDMQQMRQGDAGLKEQLEKAIQDQKFELAASLRDKVEIKSPIGPSCETDTRNKPEISKEERLVGNAMGTIVLIVFFLLLFWVAGRFGWWGFLIAGLFTLGLPVFVLAQRIRLGISLLKRKGDVFVIGSLFAVGLLFVSFAIRSKRDAQHEQQFQVRLTEARENHDAAALLKLAQSERNELLQRRALYWLVESLRRGKHGENVSLDKGVYKDVIDFLLQISREPPKARGSHYALNLKARNSLRTLNLENVVQPWVKKILESVQRSDADKATGSPYRPNGHCVTVRDGKVFDDPTSWWSDDGITVPKAVRLLAYDDSPDEILEKLSKSSVLLIESRELVVGQYQLSGAPARMVSWDVWVIDPASLKVTAWHNFLGESPPTTIGYVRGSSYGARGKPPKMFTVLEWFCSLPEK